MGPVDCVTFMDQAAAGIGYQSAIWYAGSPSRPSRAYRRRPEALRPNDPDVFSFPRFGQIPNPVTFAPKWTWPTTNPWIVR